jgi:hypothetical protein
MASALFFLDLKGKVRCSTGYREMIMITYFDLGINPG